MRATLPTRGHFSGLARRHFPPTLQVMGYFVRHVVMFLAWVVTATAATPVVVQPVTAAHGMVVAGHPQVAEIGVQILKSGGNAIDAAVATSLALGVAEPYGSGLGGKLMLVYFDAKTRKTFVVDAMDAAGSVDIAAYLKRPDADRTYGYGAVCVPGLGAGLWAAHQKWGGKTWADDLTPVIALARQGSAILPKTRDMYLEQEKKLRRGDAEIARLYLPKGELPAARSVVANPDLARTMERFAREGRDGFYRGEVADAIVSASKAGGGNITLADLARYEARIVEPVAADFRGYHLVAAPPPASGPAFFLSALKVLEKEAFGGGPLRTAANLDLIGRTWRVTASEVWQSIGDAPEARFNFERMMSPGSIESFRRKANPATPARKVAWEENEFYESAQAATTHFIVVDAAGNIVCATQSLSLHFGAGVVPPGSGVVMNNSMSNFTFSEPKHPNYIAAGKRPRSTIGPTIVFQQDKPVFAIGIPGAARIPTALLQALLDRLALNRPLDEAIGNTRFHYSSSVGRGEDDTIEAERSLSPALADQLKRLGWKVETPEDAGTGRHFGGINAVELNADGTLTGYADPRRTNVAVGY